MLPQAQHDAKYGSADSEEAAAWRGLDELCEGARLAAFKLAGLCDVSTLQALPGFCGPV